MASNTFKVSQSKIGTWRRCRYAYSLKYVEKLRRRYKARPLQFGSLVHEMIEADANGDDPFKRLDFLAKAQGKLFAVEREEFDEIVADVRAIMTDYFKYWESAPENSQFMFLRHKGKSAEHEFTIPLTKDGILLTGKMDGLALVKRKTRVLVENKTFRNMPNEDHRWRNVQSNIYLWAANELDLRVERVCWNYISSKPPTLPKMLKNGTLSAKRLNTLPAALQAFARAQKVKLPLRMIAAAESNRRNYFTRIFSAPKPKTIKMIVDNFVETAREMAEYHGKKQAKTIDRHCEWCEFEPICRAELTGSDSEFIKKKEYKVREKEDAPIQVE